MIKKLHNAATSNFKILITLLNTIRYSKLRLELDLEGFLDMKRDRATTSCTRTSASTLTSWKRASITKLLSAVPRLAVRTR